MQAEWVTTHLAEWPWSQHEARQWKYPYSIENNHYKANDELSANSSLTLLELKSPKMR